MRKSKKILLVTGIGIIILFTILIFIFSKKDAIKLFPRFHDYTMVFGDDLVRPVAINFNSNPEINKYKKDLDNIRIPDTNFAYSYRLFTMGCGTECHEVVVIDSSNGNIYFTKIISRVGIDFNSRSNLLVVNPPKDIYEVYGNNPKKWPRDDWGNDLKTYFYVWENNQFTLIQASKINYDMY